MYLQCRSVCRSDNSVSDVLTLFDIEVSCIPPPLPGTGHGNVSISTSGSSTEASYHCNRGYVMLDFRGQIVVGFVMKCDQSGRWSSSSPTCGKLRLKFCTSYKVKK